MLVFVVAAVMAACGAGSTPASGGGFITVSGAWVRPAPKDGTTAAYLQIVNGRLSDDVLVGVSTDAAERASLHETSTDAQGMTGMQPVDGITIPAGQTVQLEPGGYHIMLEHLTDGLSNGSTIRLVLTFEQSGPLNVTAQVRAG
jgi:copper(I)-binding protein